MSNKILFLIIVAVLFANRKTSFYKNQFWILWLISIHDLNQSTQATPQNLLQIQS